MSRAALSIFLLGACLLAFPRPASAACGTLACQVYIEIISNSGGVTLTGSGTATATMPFGTVQAFGGTLPTGVTRAVNASSFTLSTTFNIYVYCEDLVLLGACSTAESPSYQLTAQLQTADGTNTWTVAGSALSSASATILTAAGTYGVSNPYSFTLKIPFSEAAGSLNHTISFVATTN